MKKKLNIKKLFLLLIPVLLLMATSVTMFASQNKLHAATLHEENEILSSYIVGDKITCAGATLTIDSKTQKADVFLYYPSGKAFAGESFILSESGKYTLEYRSVFDGTLVKQEKNFIAYLSLCEFNGSGSSFDIENNGVKVDLSEGTELVFNSVLDLSDVTKDDELINIKITPSVMSEADFTKITVKFTQVDDKNNYFKVLLQSSPVNQNASYALAGATNQAMTGYEEELDRIHKNNQWGAFFPLSFYGNEGFSNELSIRYNALTKEVYSKKGNRIIDFDNPDFFPNVWNGFTNNKVKVSITASGYRKNIASFVVTKLKDTTIESKNLIDDMSPKISIDYGNNTEVPLGKINTKYNLFPARAFDSIDGERAVKANVFYCYKQLNSCNIDSYDGYFVPEKVGVYTIEYTAYDMAGNKAVQIVNVNVKNSLPPIELAYSGDKTTQGNIGVKTPIASVIASGGSGNITVETKVKFAGKETKIDKEFIPEVSGNYEIIYTATDYLGSEKTLSYIFNGVSNDTPIFDTLPNLPKYFIKGKSYDFPVISALDYSDGKKQIRVCDINILADGQTYKVVGKTKIDFNADKVSVIYSCKNAKLAQDVSIVDVGKNGSIDMQKYFVATSGVSKVSNESGVEFTSKGEVEFIKEVLSQELSLKFSAKADSGLSKFSVMLTDFNNPNIAIQLTYEKKGDRAIFYINGKFMYEFAEAGFTANSITNDFTLDFIDNIVKPTGDVSLKINSDLAGNKFNGFSSNKVYIKYIISETDGTLVVKNINGQPINRGKSDRIRPKIVIYGNYGGEYAQGSVVSLPKANALDVLDAEINFGLSVYKPDGSFVKDKNGLVLDNVDPGVSYDFVVENYGNYKVKYTASDSNNGTESVNSFTIIVEDKIKPIIEVSYGDKTCKKGETIIIPTATYADNITSVDKLISYVFLTFTSGEIIEFRKGSNSFVASSAGVYTIVFTVYDEAGNMGIKKINIKVE